MAKMPWIRFFPNDWLHDTRILTDAEKATWIDIICFMWNSPKRGTLTGHPSDLARMVGKEWLELSIIIDALERKGVCDITRDANGDARVTLVSRRMRRDGDALEKNRLRQEKYRESHRLRQKRYREKLSNANITPKKSEVRSQKSNKDITTLSPNGDHKDAFKAEEGKDNGPTPRQLVSLWNSEAHPNLPRVSLLTDRRKIIIKARLTEHPAQSFWIELIEKVNNSPLLRGENDRSWKCNFDWILNINNMTKILEGNYDPIKRNN